MLRVKRDTASFSWSAGERITFTAGRLMGGAASISPRHTPAGHHQLEMRPAARSSLATWYTVTSVRGLSGSGSPFQGGASITWSSLSYRMPWSASCTSAETAPASAAFVKKAIVVTTILPPGQGGPPVAHHADRRRLHAGSVVLGRVAQPEAWPWAAALHVHAILRDRLAWAP
jgi:hypothetical protein